MMVESDMSCDYIIATGNSHSLGEIGEYAARVIRIDKDVAIDRSGALIRPLDIQVYRFNPQRSANGLGWQSSVDFEKPIYNLAKNICI